MANNSFFEAPAWSCFRIVVFWVLGTAAALALALPLSTLWLYLLALGTASATCLCICPKAQTYRGILSLLLVAGVGGATVRVQLQQQESWSQWMDRVQLEGYCVVLERVFPAKGPWVCCKARIRYVKVGEDWHSGRGKATLFFPQSEAYVPQRGDRLLVAGVPKVQPAAAANPDRMAAPFGVEPREYRCFFGPGSAFALLPTAVGGACAAEQAQIRCLRALQKQLPDASAVAFLQALFFGDKTNLPPALRAAYAATGTVHVLAVSGLHAGMLHALFRWALRLWFRGLRWVVVAALGKRGQPHRFGGGFWSVAPEIAAVGLLWGYAWLCQWAPPVLRATTAIALARVGRTVQRPVDPWHALWFSAFASLVWKPLWLFHWGFQLSYLATIGLLGVYPMLRGALAIRRSWLRKLWDTSALSLAAQLTTLPLLLHYFQQFPTYFVPANWLVVPAVFAILVGSVALLVVGEVAFLGPGLAWLLQRCVQGLHAWVGWMARLPCALLACAPTTVWEVALGYVALGATWLFFRRKKGIYALLVVACMGLHTVRQVQGALRAARTARVVFSSDGWYRLHDRTGTWTHLEALAQRPSCVQPFPGGALVAWHGKIFACVETMAPEWYGVRGPKITIDRLLIGAELLPDIDALAALFAFQTLVVRAPGPRALGRSMEATFGRLGIADVRWVRPGGTEEWVWETTR